MGKIIEPEPVKLIIGLIGKEGLFKEAEQVLSSRFGLIDYKSKSIDFIFTDYYKKEMGPELKRKFLSFKDLIQPDELPDIKCYTNKLETEIFSVNHNRLFNIDPGYLTLAKLVLATTKDYQHRIYIGKGIYAEMTLKFKKKSFVSWEWTYPDYATKEYIDIFNEIRKKFKG